MTRKDAIEWFTLLREKFTGTEYGKYLDIAIEALEQESCEDCISRKEAKRLLANRRDELMMLNSKDNPKADATAHGVNWSLNTLMELPSVTPSYNSIKPELKPFEDCISRQAALKQSRVEYNDDGEGYGVIYIEDIEDLPPVTPQPKMGHWIEHPEIETSAPEYLMFYECSECGDKQCFCKSDLHKKRFCPNCGAKMEVAE